MTRNCIKYIVAFAVSLGLSASPLTAKPSTKQRKKTVIAIEKCRGIGIYVACPQFTWSTGAPVGSDVYFTRQEFQALQAASNKEKAM